MEETPTINDLLKDYRQFFIYGYRYNNGGQDHGDWAYVGSAEDKVFRHRKRRRRRKTEAFVRSFERDGNAFDDYPPETLAWYWARRTEYTVVRAARETEWMHKCRTLAPVYGRGYNKMRPGKVDYTELGRIGGRRRIQLYGNPATPESCSKGGRIGGPISGRKNIESGHIQALGRKSVESGFLDRIRNLPHAKKAQQESGRRVGERLAKERPEHFVRMNRIANGAGGRKTAREHPEQYSRMGRIGGRKNVESGHMQALGRGQTGNHTRWHVKRGITNPNCELCSPRPLTVN